MLLPVNPDLAGHERRVAAAPSAVSLNHSITINARCAMRRLAQIFAAVGASMCVACSGDPPTVPRLTPDAPPPAADTQLVRRSEAARSYLLQLRSGVSSGKLTDTKRLERIGHIERFVRATDSSIRASRYPMRASLDEEPETPIDRRRRRIRSLRPEPSRIFVWHARTRRASSRQRLQES